MFVKTVIYCFVACIALTTSFVKSAIIYETNWEVPYPGSLDSRAIYFVGEPNEYEIFPTNYRGGQQSDAQCQRLLNNQQGHFTGPCETSIAKHDQSFNVQCTADRKNAASIVFFRDGGDTDHQASIVTAGSIYGGFTYENDDQPLRQSTTKAIIGKALVISPTTNAKNATIKDGIDLVEGWQPAQGETIHTITLVGDGRKYHIKAEKYAKNKSSNATCNATVVKGKKVAKSPCSTDVKEHDQIFTVGCTNDEKSNFARFIVNVSGEIEINTHGKIWAGFTSDSKDQQLRQSEPSMDPLKASGNDVGVVINCVNDERTLSDGEQ